MTVLPSEADIIDKIEHVRSGPEPDLGVPIEFFKAPGRVSGTASAAAHQQQLLCLGRQLRWCPRLHSGL